MKAAPNKNVSVSQFPVSSANLTFDDEFNSVNLWNGSSGTWEPSYYWSPNGFSSSDMSSWLVNPNFGPTSAPDADPYSVTNGVLSMAVMSRPADVSASSIGGKNYLSGMLTTHPSLSQKYGYFEMRAEMSATPGTMSAFWLLPANGSWPPELDVAEVLANYPTSLFTSVHTNETGSLTTATTTTTEPNMTKGFHTYGVDWEADDITFYFDGQQVFQTPTPSDMHQPMYLLLDTMAGTSSSWEGAPPSGSQSSAMLIDYIRVYNSDPYTSTPTPTPTPAPTPSANDTILLPGTSATIIDSRGNEWTLTAGDQVAVNGTADATTANVGELAYVNGEIWQQNSSGLWWGKTTPTGSWSPAGGSTTSPLPLPTKIASMSGTVILTGSTAEIIDAVGDAWTITGGGQVAVNGTVDTTTANVTEIAFVKGQIWQENRAKLWWSKTSPTGTWGPMNGTSVSPLPATPAAVPTPNPNSTTLSISTVQASTIVSQSNISVLATAGNHIMFVTGSGDTLTLLGGNETIIDTGSHNTYAIPAAGTGALTFTSNILLGTDILDLRPVLAGTQWNGGARTIGSYLHVADTTTGAVLSVSATAGGSTTGVASFSGATTATLKTILAHAIA